jgi:hypothetical protein
VAEARAGTAAQLARRNLSVRAGLARASGAINELRMTDHRPGCVRQPTVADGLAALLRSQWLPTWNGPHAPASCGENANSDAG